MCRAGARSRVLVNVLLWVTSRMSVCSGHVDAVPRHRRAHANSSSMVPPAFVFTLMNYIHPPAWGNQRSCNDE
jgi:hypothetical protein